MDETNKDISDYLDAILRRRVSIGVIATSIFIIGCLVAILWPATYRSAATILIEEQEIPSELVRSTVTSYALQRIEEIKQRVMTRSRMMEIIEQYDLYSDERKRETTEEIISRIRNDITMEPISADVIDPISGRPTAATIAFKLAFKGENPAKVQKVANDLTSMYLEENLKTRATKASETYKFLTDEANRLSDEISRREAKLAEFKEANLNRLPELKSLNTTLMERTERELDSVKSEIQSLHDRQIYLEGQLTLIDPHGENVQMSPSARLKALRTEYIALRARYSDDHPDVQRMKREIEGLERKIGVVDDSDAIQQQLAALNNDLVGLQERYSDDHPDVVRLKQTIAGLEADLAKSDSASQRADLTPASPDNPAYVTLQSQLNQTQGEIANAESRRGQLEKKLAQLEKRLIETPQVEREFQILNRGYQNAVTKYQEIKAKQLQAEIAQQLEAERKGERFTLIDPAALPEEPISPNRPAILFLSLVLALGGGLGYALAVESMDSSVRGVKGVVQAVRVAPLAVIPYLENDREVSMGKRRNLAAVAGTLAIVVVALLLIHYFWTPLDVLWFKALRRASTTTGIDL